MSKIHCIVPTESQEQAALIDWCRLDPRTDCIFAIPNGANKSRAAAAKFKREGLKPGVPDLFLPVPVNFGLDAEPEWKHGLFIEMKRTKGGVISQDQEDWAKYLKYRDYEHVFAFGAAEAVAAIRKYLFQWPLPPFGNKL